MSEAKTGRERVETKETLVDVEPLRYVYVLTDVLSEATLEHKHTLHAGRNHVSGRPWGHGRGEGFAGSMRWQLHLHLCSLSTWTAPLQLDQLLRWRWLVMELKTVRLLLMGKHVRLLHTLL